MRNKLFLTNLLVLLFGLQSLFAQHNPNCWGDLGNGKYRNMILPADYSDPDVIRMGNDYYMVSSTFQFSPGIVILNSRDMVNWSTIGAVVGNLPKQIGIYNYNNAAEVGYVDVDWFHYQF